MSDYEKQDWFNTEIFCYLQQELFGDVWEWPDGVTIEERETKPCDTYQKWSESHVRIMVDGKIAAEMNISEETVKIHRSRVMQKLGIVSVAELVRLCEKIGITPAESNNQ